MFAPEHVLEVLQELEEKVGTHATHSAADVVVLTDFAIKHGASKAERTWADLHKDEGEEHEEQRLERHKEVAQRWTPRGAEEIE